MNLLTLGYCCNNPEYSQGTIWGLSLLPVKTCTNCDHTEAKFGSLGEVILVIGDLLFNQSDGFVIKLGDKINDPMINLLKYKQNAPNIYS